ncbi:MAG: hypothetical protein J7639_30275 [Paenibacillaceae bacterium]|nr:hypothetical protein [Paenibacillaceae bacterium]
MMKKVKLVVWALMLVIGVLAVPASGFASPGNYTLDGSSYGSWWINETSSHSPYVFDSHERKFSGHFENYVFQFAANTNGSGSTVLVAFQNPTTGAVVMSPSVISGSGGAKLFLNGDYNVIVWDAPHASTGYMLTVSAYAPGQVNVLAPTSFLLKGNTYQIEASVSGTPTAVNAYAVDAGGTEYSIGALSLSGGTYKRNYTFNTTYSSNNGATMPKLRVKATYAVGGTVSSDVSIYVTNQNAAYYSGMDSTWFYSSTWNNSFVGMANNDQMCYEYAVDQRTVSGEPYQIDQDVIDYMLKQNGSYHNWTGRAGTLFTSYSTTPIPYPDVIYFSGFHWAKVTQWDASGNPTELLSKWGPDEVIKSTSANAFSGGSYGSPRLYFKK